MPNVDPRGWFVRPDGTTAVPVIDVFASDGVAWQPAQFVHASDGTVLNLIWARGAAPAENVVASLLGNGTVQIDWTAFDPEAVDTYRVRRSDDSVVDTAIPDGGPYTVIDLTPLPGTQTWFVESDLLGVPVQQIESNSIDIDLSPASAAHVFNAEPHPNRTCTITWLGEVTGTTAVEIYRPGGALAGAVGAGVGTFIDTNPTADHTAGQYNVIPLNASSDPAGSVLSDPAEDMAIAPPSADVTETGDQDVAVGVNVTWDIGVGEHTAFQVSKQRWNGTGEAASNVADDLPEGVGVYLWQPSNDNYGTTSEVRVGTKMNANLSPVTVADDVVWTPGVPAAVAAVPTGVLGELELAWGDPVVGAVKRFEVETSEDDLVWDPLSTDASSPVVHAFTGSSGTRYMRVRAIGYGRDDNDGGIGDWVEVAADPQWDFTPPVLPDVTVWKPDGTYGQMKITFKTSASDNYEYRVRKSDDGVNFTNKRGWTSVGNNETITIGSVITGSNGDTLTGRVQVRDVWGNTDTIDHTYTLKAAQQTVNVDFRTHLRAGVWDFAGNGFAYQGYFSDPGSEYDGYIFYTQSIADKCDAISSIAGKITVSNIKVRNLSRNNSIGSSVVSIFIGTHNKTSASGTAPVSNPVSEGTLNNQGETKTMQISNTNRNALRDGTAKGIGFHNSGSANYMAIDSGGQIEINSLG